MPGFDLQQRQTQSQIQTMSQKQIQSLELLSLGSEDLRAAVYKAAEENPALVITSDPLSQGADVVRVSKGPIDYTHLSSSTTAAAREASDNFQAALESQEDNRTSLKEHLLMQYHVLKLSNAELALGEKLIHNLNDKGFHTLAPVSLLDRTDPEQTDDLLERCMTKIQHLDPIGTCTTGTEESLYVQACMNPTSSPLSLFILNGHFSFLDPPQSGKVVKKITAWIQDQRSLFGRTESDEDYDSLEVTEEKVEEAIAFIKTLDPFPARDYGTSETQYIAPDVYVKRIPVIADHDDFPRGIVTDGVHTWQLTLAHDNVPQLEISSEFENLTDKEKDKQNERMLSSADKKLVTDSVKKAQEFLEQLAFRESTLLTACCIIVKKQHDFFAKGPGSLIPFKQQDVADELGVHETTISRMANSKFIQCEWGLFDIKYFFTNAATTRATGVISQDNSANDTQVAVSKEKAMMEIKNILEEHKDDKKQLSDQKVCDILAEHGIPIARRTVAKYRTQLDINSSYAR